jgi:hypothetical protein
MSDQKPSYVLELGQRIFKIKIETGAIENARFTLIKNRKGKNSALVKEIKGFIHLPAYNKNHAKVLYDKIIAKALNICSVCGGENKQMVECERCHNNHCNDCQAVYNQHTQIDFNCCKTCAKIYE